MRSEFFAGARQRPVQPGADQLPRRTSSFSIALFVLLALVPSVAHSQNPSRSYLGVQLQDLKPEIASALRIERGISVIGVNMSSPAQKAGLKPMDIITAIDGDPIETGQGFSAAVAARQPGSIVQVTLVREGKTLNLSATLDSAPAQFPPVEQSWFEGAGLPSQSGGRYVIGGATIATLAPAMTSPLAFPSGSPKKSRV